MNVLQWLLNMLIQVVFQAGLSVIYYMIDGHH
jgi:hypothetical protein